ncbi:gastric inhibitory polypeptide receptor isoform X2 [Strix uralensis]|uniref:gastric inhibitory polypeptide receptor isoform X2 n=1 Tax=Strix uralensis TaxID=36305 RepID=UPI003DA71C46
MTHDTGTPIPPCVPPHTPPGAAVTIMGHQAVPPALLNRVLRGAEEERSAQATLAAWREYRHACELRLRLDPPAPGPVCNRSFDMYACWGDAAPNSTVTVPCPWYLPWHHRVQGGVVARRCGPDGHWVTDETGRPWRDHSQCEDLAQEQPLQRQAWLLEQFRLLYTVGYSLSLVALLLALLLLLLFRRLRCTRNFIHANLFLSFVLRAGAILTRDALLRRRLRPGPGHPLQLLGQQAVAGCRLAQALTQYCVGANYGWLLAEGLFLHKLLVLAAFSGERCLPAFLLLGWGAPVLFVVPWVVVRYFYENEGCWERNEKPAVWWIIRCPILMAVAVNFVVFVRIVRILVAKVRAHQVSRGDTRVRWGHGDTRVCVGTRHTGRTPCPCPHRVPVSPVQCPCAHPSPVCVPTCVPIPAMSPSEVLSVSPCTSLSPEHPECVPECVPVHVPVPTTPRVCPHACHVPKHLPDHVPIPVTSPGVSPSVSPLSNATKCVPEGVRVPILL